MTELTGKTFAGYEILAKLGEGGMGTVYKARQPLLNRVVALKVMASHLTGDASYVSRFINEASTAASLNHPNMVLVHTAGEHEGHYHIVMEYVEGRSLHEHIERRKRVDPREALAITVYVARALQYAWTKARMIHRDVKPANIFLSTSGDVKLGDMGLAKSPEQSSSSTMAGMVMGSAHYMSPEQARGVKNLDFRADIYSLGCTLFHMLTGRMPFEGDEALGVMLKQIHDPIPDLLKERPECPPELGDLLRRMMAKDPAHRPQSYDLLIAELLAVNEQLKADGEYASSTSRAASAAPSMAVRLPTMPRLAGKRLAMFLGGLAVLGLVAVFWAPWKHRDHPSQPSGPGATAITPTTAATVVPAGFLSLFNARDLTGWRARKASQPSGWAVREGLLVNTPPSQDLLSDASFGDFELHAEFQAPKGANSGIYLRGRYEVQILDDYGKPANNACSGSLFKQIAPSQNAAKPAGEWQTMDVTLVGKTVTVILNGKKVINRALLSRPTEQALDNDVDQPGPIRLQGTHGPVVFSGVSIKPLGGGPLGASAALDPWANAVQLLPMVDLKRDAVEGSWTARPDGLLSDMVFCGRVQIPYQPPEEYDLRVEFTRLDIKRERGDKGWGDNAMMLQKDGQRFHYYMGAHGNTWFGFELVGGKRFDANSTGVHVDECLKLHQSYTTVVMVRKQAVKAYLDGKLVTEWRPEMGALREGKYNNLPDPHGLGIGACNVQTVFHKVELREVTGHGKSTRPARP